MAKLNRRDAIKATVGAAMMPAVELKAATETGERFTNAIFLGPGPVHPLAKWLHEKTRIMRARLDTGEIVLAYNFHCGFPPSGFRIWIDDYKPCDQPCCRGAVKPDDGVSHFRRG